MLWLWFADAVCISSRNKTLSELIRYCQYVALSRFDIRIQGYYLAAKIQGADRDNYRCVSSHVIVHTQLSPGRYFFPPQSGPGDNRQQCNGAGDGLYKALVSKQKDICWAEVQRDVGSCFFFPPL